MLVTEQDRDAMAADVNAVIEAFTETAEIIRPTVTGVGSFAGSYEAEETSLGTIPLEFKQLSAEELKQIGADGVCSTPPDSGIQENDILIYQESRYRETELKLENCFGAVTHLTVKLERIYQS